MQLATGLAKPTKLALIVRADIKLSKGKTAAQCSHATVACYEMALKHCPIILNEWRNAGQPKIVLKVNDLTEMETLYKNSKSKNIIAEMVRDAGRTQVAAGTITVMGIGPYYQSDIDLLVNHLKLL